MKDYKEAIESIMKDTTSKVMDHAIKAYRQGYEDGQKEKLANAMIHNHEVAEKTAYEQGLNDSWECARKMCLMSSAEERLRAFDVSGSHLAILSDLTASKAIEKLKAFEQKQKCKECKKTKDPIFYGHCVCECDYAKQTEDEIKVGDEVIVQVDRIGFVTGFDVLFDRVYVTTKDGWSDAFGGSFVKKTGRHFDDIKNVLDQIGGK